MSSSWCGVGGQWLLRRRTIVADHQRHYSWSITGSALHQARAWSRWRTGWRTDWAAERPRRSRRTRTCFEPILKAIGTRKLRELTAGDARRALSRMATEYSSAVVSMGHLTLKRVIRHAEAKDLVSRNVATLVDPPKGQDGSPSKFLSLEEAAAVIDASSSEPRPSWASRTAPSRSPATCSTLSQSTMSQVCGAFYGEMDGLQVVADGLVGRRRRRSHAALARPESRPRKFCDSGRGGQCRPLTSSSRSRQPGRN